MAKLYHEGDADISLIQGKKVAIIGYGSQGHAHALNLKDSGVDVRVGLPATSASRAKAEAAGVAVMDVPQAAAWADVIMVLIPDTKQGEVFKRDIEPNLKPGKTLMFAHGFNIRYGTIKPAKDIDVSMVAPKAPGHRVREVFTEGGGTPGLLAIHQDASGNAKPMALSYAKGIGCTRAGVIETTFSEETETDLFGEQAVLCGGTSALVKAAFQTLVDAGYQPEIAYFECMHELKLIVDLMYRGGLNYMRYSVSDTAEHGDYTGGPRIVTDETRKAMKQMLKEIQDGTYANNWIKENETGRPWFNKIRKSEQGQLLETVGAELRSHMPFLNPVTIKQSLPVVTPPAGGYLLVLMMARGICPVDESLLQERPAPIWVIKARNCDREGGSASVRRAGEGTCRSRAAAHVNRAVGAPAPTCDSSYFRVAVGSPTKIRQPFGSVMWNSVMPYSRSNNSRIRYRSRKPFTCSHSAWMPETSM